MRNLYSTLVALGIATLSFAQWGEIPNGGFENWSLNTLYDYPTQWGNSNTNEFSGIPSVFKSTDAQLGSFSCELAVGLTPMNDTVIGYVFHGGVGQSGPDTGIPYTATFDEVRFQYKSDFPAGDSVYLICIRFQGGSMIEMNILPAINGTAGTWTQGSVSVPNTAQDSLFLGFVTGDPFGGPRPTPGAWARIDNVQMYNLGAATTPLPDPSFEDWTTQSVESVDDWFTMNEMLAGAGLENATKSTDANSGMFALELQTLVNSNMDTIPGFISMGPMNFGIQNPFTPAPYTATPTTFSGAYKYTPNNGDQGWIQIEFFQGGASVGTHFEPLMSAASWTPFSSSLSLSGAPDSVMFVATSGFNPTSTLLLDDLQFSGGDVGLEEFKSMQVSMYPNPAMSIVMLKAEGTFNIAIVDLAGNVVLSRNNVIGAVELDITQLSEGTYVVTIFNDAITESHKLIVQ